MKKVVVGLVLLFSFIWVKSYLGQKLETKDTLGVVKNTQGEQVVPSNTNLAPEIRKEVVSPKIPAQDEIKTPASEFKNKKNSQENVSLSQHEQKIRIEKTPEQLAQEKLKIPIGEELKKATPFTAWRSSESFFTGIYQGRVNVKGQNYLIRMNLMFDGTNNDITPSTCVAMYSTEKAIFRETYGNGNINLLRTEDEKYIILSVSDQFYFQIFQTMSGNRRSFRTHLTTHGEKDPFIFNLNELPRPDSLDECQNIQ
ncbi:MAG: hypothetical protein ACXWRE_17080 [Pseudobdellovibrionaceae bacterium]